jgi:energy-coupling factor transport system permease protein
MFQSRPVLLGQYRPLDSYLHQLDARAKMVPVTLALVLSLITASMAYYLVILAALILFLLISKVGARTLVANFKPLLLLVLITAVYHLVFSGRDSETVVNLFGWRLTTVGVHMAAFYSLRLVLFVAIAFLVTLTSSPSELAEAFTKILRPLKALRVPVHDLSLILFMAIRFIPVLYEEFMAIRNAQIIRGVRFSGSFVNRIRKTVYIIIPVFVSAIQRADDIALAIQARGYNGSKERTFYSRSKFGRRELVFALASTAFVLAVYGLTLQ